MNLIRFWTKLSNFLQKLIGGHYWWDQINFCVFWEIPRTSVNFNVKLPEAKIQPKARQEFSNAESASHHITSDSSHWHYGALPVATAPCQWLLAHGVEAMLLY